MPRHPPCALKNLTTIILTKMLASTVQFSSYGRSHTPTRTGPCSSHRSETQEPAFDRGSCDPLAVTLHRPRRAGDLNKQTLVRSLRTQQRAKTPHPTSDRQLSIPPSEPDRSTRHQPPKRSAIVDVPPVSTAPDTFGRGTGLDNPHPPLQEASAARAP